MTADQTQGSVDSMRPQGRQLTRTDDRLIVFFDIDNTLYSASSKISEAMGTRIHGASPILHRLHLCILTDASTAYFLTLGLSDEEASDLHHKYYSQYGLALRGLTRHHNVGEAAFPASSSSRPSPCTASRPDSPRPRSAQIH